MNAKKIMGAVLVALLAAALFVGAGAAVPPVSSTVFVNQALSSDYDVDWIGSNGAFNPSFDPVTSKYYFPAGSEGVYTYEPTAGTKYTVTVTALKATISAFAGSGIYAYPIIGSTYFQDSGDVNVVIGYVPTLTGSPVYSVYMTTPDYADKLIVDENSNGVEDEIKEIILNGKVGDYSIVVAFNATNFVTGTLYTDLFTAPVSFKIAEAGAATIAASANQALKSEDVKITITGQPGAWYKVFYEANAFEGAANQMGLPGVNSAIGGTGFYFQMPNTGSVNFAVNGGSIDADSAKMNVQRAVANNGALDTDAKKATVTIKFLKGTITAEADAASYFVGDKITISGTNNAGTIKGYSVKGTNFEAVEENFNDFTEGNPSSKNFEFEINTANVKDDNKKLDVGTYTITIFVDSMTNPTAKATVAVVLKQPFISIVDAPEVIVQDTKAEFVINAEAVKVNNADAPYIAYYIFGTNYFKTGAGIQDDEVKTNYIVTLNEDTTDNMSAGQYFAVFQHPMYDGVFNVTGNDDTWWISVNGDETINVKNRQTANAAQALCDALDIQSIDDMYVKYSFFVVGEDESFTISEIPTTIAKGETLTISGVSTANADKYVTVEMISTAFAAVPKETVGSAAFIAVTTQIADDGTWEVTFDTSDLNVDEYSLKVACSGEDKPWKNVNINVVEAADKPDTPDTPDVPDTPDTPDTPTEPETPGFGALAALAGLGAVAVLLLRRE